MFLMIMMSMLVILILSMMLFINMLISKKNFKSREKVSPFECGFDPQSTGRMPFSLQFYLISIIFLIFDVEIALILPMVKSLGLYFVNLNFLVILLILLGGLFLEWKEGALKWFK